MKRPPDRGGRFALNSAIVLRVIAVAVTAIIIEPVGATHRGLRRAVGLAWRSAILSGRSAVWSGVLRLLHHLAAVPDRPAAYFGGADIRHRTLRSVGSEDRIAHRIEEPAGLALLSRTALEFLD